MVVAYNYGINCKHNLPANISSYQTQHIKQNFKKKKTKSYKI